MVMTNNRKNRALFLDRDGVINMDKGFVHKIEDCEFVPGIFDICLKAKQNDFLLIVVTNQSGIARGYYTEEDFHKLMDYIRGEFAIRGCPLDDVFYCPFHPEGLHPYKCDSPDRKPAPGMILKASDKYNIDLSRSAMLGDKNSDIVAGKEAGVKYNILVNAPDAMAKLDKFFAENGRHD